MRANSWQNAIARNVGNLAGIPFIYNNVVLAITIHAGDVIYWGSAAERAVGRLNSTGIVDGNDLAKSFSFGY